MSKHIKNNSFSILLSTTIVIVVFSLLVTIFIHSSYSLSYTKEIPDRKILSPIAEISTRTNNINTTQLVNSALSNFGSGCPSEAAIYIHGYNKNETEAREEFDRIQTSLIYNNYRIPLVGFSWDSKENWETAKNNARENGLYLAQFIMAFKNKCENTDIHLIAHSLGASVVDQSLVILDVSPSWNSKIASAHLLGAAGINNRVLGNNTFLGNATENVVEKFYNLYNPQDEGLKVNQEVDNYQPLGLAGAPKGTVLFNYNDTNVVYEIPPLSDADGDGNTKECFEDIQPSRLWGNNHCGYIGFRNSTTGALTDDGVMDIVVRDWISS